MPAAVVPILTAVGSAVATSVVSRALAPHPSGPPPLSAPMTMPISDDAAAQQAKQKSIASQVARRGRASTILTGSQGLSETLG